MLTTRIFSKSVSLIPPQEQYPTSHERLEYRAATIRTDSRGYDNQILATEVRLGGTHGILRQKVEFYTETAMIEILREEAALLGITL